MVDTPKRQLKKTLWSLFFFRVWHGIVGLMSDEIPLLVIVQGKPGLSVCAIFNGHSISVRLPPSRVGPELIILQVMPRKCNSAADVSKSVVGTGQALCRGPSP